VHAIRYDSVIAFFLLRSRNISQINKLATPVQLIIGNTENLKQRCDAFKVREIMHSSLDVCDYCPVVQRSKVHYTPRGYGCDYGDTPNGSVQFYVSRDALSAKKT